MDQKIFKVISIETFKKKHQNLKGALKRDGVGKAT